MKKWVLPNMAWVILMLVALGETFLLASIDDHHHRASHILGLDVAMTQTQANTVSWIVISLSILWVVAAAINKSLRAFLGFIAVMAMIMANWASELPSPQDRWQYGLIYLAGMVTIYLAAQPSVRKWLESIWD